MRVDLGTAFAAVLILIGAGALYAVLALVNAGWLNR